LIPRLKAWLSVRINPEPGRFWQENFSRDQISTGRFSYGDPLRIRANGPDPSWVRIGQFCSIGPGVVFLDGGHHYAQRPTTSPLQWLMSLPMAVDWMLDKGDVIVGNDVWIGRDARILSGVKIGHGAIVAGYSVVTKDVEPYAIVAGNPARVKGARFPDEQIERMLVLAWWDWPEEKIRRAAVDLLAPDIDAFLRRWS
jgi:acetyltransferase-like isoleucine patch superfamily enzyme